MPFSSDHKPKGQSHQLLTYTNREETVKEKIISLQFRLISGEAAFKLPWHLIVMQRQATQKPWTCFVSPKFRPVDLHLLQKWCKQVVIVKMLSTVSRSLGVLGWLFVTETAGKNPAENRRTGTCRTARNRHILWRDVTPENAGAWKPSTKLSRDYVKGWRGRSNRNGCPKSALFGSPLTTSTNFKRW